MGCDARIKQNQMLKSFFLIINPVDLQDNEYKAKPKKALLPVKSLSLILISLMT